MPIILDNDEPEPLLATSGDGHCMSTTFLQYVVHLLLGPPAKYEGSSKDAIWICFVCGETRLHVPPPHPAYKDRGACWGCDYPGHPTCFLPSSRTSRTY